MEILSVWKCAVEMPPVDSKVCGGGVVHVQVVYAVVQLFAQYAAIIYCAKSQLQIVQLVVDYCATICTVFSMQEYSIVQKVNYKYYICNIKYLNLN